MLVRVKATRPDVTLIDPTNGRVIPPEGAIVERSTWWLRRQRDGDAVISAADAALDDNVVPDDTDRSAEGG